MTEIVDIPETLPLNPFPHVDDPEENYNAAAYEVGQQLPPAIERMREIAEAGRTNAVATHERAQIASNAAAAAVPAASRAEAARDRAVQAEQAIDQALVDGPVLSVDGQTGVVELHLNARMQATALLF